LDTDRPKKQAGGSRPAPLGDKKGIMIQLIHVEIAGFIGAVVFGVLWAVKWLRFLRHEYKQ
jgi:hypothetical protein